MGPLMLRLKHVASGASWDVRLIRTDDGMQLQASLDVCLAGRGFCCIQRPRVVLGACLFPVCVFQGEQLLSLLLMPQCPLRCVLLQPGDLRLLVRTLQAGVGSHLLVELQPEECTTAVFVAKVRLVARCAGAVSVGIIVYSTAEEGSR